MASPSIVLHPYFGDIHQYSVFLFLFHVTEYLSEYTDGMSRRRWRYDCGTSTLAAVDPTRSIQINLSGPVDEMWPTNY